MATRRRAVVATVIAVTITAVLWLGIFSYVTPPRNSTTHFGSEPYVLSVVIAFVVFAFAEICLKKSISHWLRREQLEAHNKS